MASTDKVLSTIGALNTLIENFPMSLLDLFKGKTYTSVFEFIIDVLYACGVNVNEIITHLLNKIYSIIPNIEGGLEDFKETIANADFTQVQQSEFLMALEDGIKDILMTLLSSMYGCSAIPVLPNKVMDYPNPDSFNRNINTNLWSEKYYPATFDIPIKLIDPMGILEISPTTTEGRAYYEVNGRDVVYKKKTIINNNNVLAFNYENIINCDIFLTTEDKDDKIYIYFNTSEELPEDITISMGYINTMGGHLLKWDTDIKISDKKSSNGFIINKNGKNTLLTIEWIKINNKLGSCNLKTGIRCHLSNQRSKDVIKKYNIFNSVIWGDKEDTNIVYKSINSSKSYEYEIVEDASTEEYKLAQRRNHCPPEATETDPDLIVVYEGINPNMLYQTFDMNAFIWYTLVKSSRTNQTSINHTMWDSRLPSIKKGIKRDWISWYSSKQTPFDEFKYIKNGKEIPITKESALFPIIQLKKSPYNLYALDVSIPSQRYFKPTYRERVLSGEEEIKINPALVFNASIYRFNKEYLDSIQILRPKLMLTGFVEYMLGFALNTVNSINVNPTKKIIENKLSIAIKNIIEADDMNVEDCYTTFSNEEFDTMLNDMLLSRYNATYYGGEENKIKQHNLDYYLNIIDSFNTSTTREESVEKITRLIDEVIASPGSEGSIEYGINIGMDNNLLQKLLWAITMPIAQSLFTPQVMLLIVINMSLTGVVKINDFSGNDLGLIMNLLMNKILGLLKSIVKFIKDLISKLLIDLLLTHLNPLLRKYISAVMIERLEDWLKILTAALEYLPNFKFKSNKMGGIDEVAYADIINTGTTTSPESSSKC